MTIIRNFFEMLLDLFIMLHKIGLEMIRQIPYNYQHYSESAWSIVKLLIILLSLLFIDFLVIFGIFYLIYNMSIIIRTKRLVRSPILGTVINKEYREEQVTFKFNISSKIPITITHFHPEKFNIYVSYNNKLKKMFNNKEIFGRYNEGDTIPLILVQYLDKKNHPILQELELPE